MDEELFRQLQSLETKKFFKVENIGRDIHISNLEKKLCQAIIYVEDEQINQHTFHDAYFSEDEITFVIGSIETSWTKISNFKKLVIDCQPLNLTIEIHLTKK
jgi:hypothetical protein